MLDFNFCVSTNFIFGKDTRKHVGETAAALGVKKVMLVYDSGQFLQQTVFSMPFWIPLKSADLTVTELTGVLPNPPP
ncbi:MAG: iron-containing alcohol dehydrogenase [Eubacteriales bacterium]